MKKMLPIIIIMLLLMQNFIFADSTPEIGIKGISLKNTGNGSYALSFYTTYRGLNPEIFSDEKSVILNEKTIARGTLNKNSLTERDMLFSQLNVDLDGDGKFTGRFSVKMDKDAVSIGGKPFYITHRNHGRVKAIIPGRDGNRKNYGSIGDKGAFLNIRRYDPKESKMEIGILDQGNPEVKFNGSAVMIEILYPEQKTGSSPSLSIDKIFTGTVLITDERLANDGPLNRVWGLKEIKTVPGSLKNEFSLNNLPSQFKIRITYFFTISENLVIYTEKSEYAGIK